MNVNWCNTINLLQVYLLEESVCTPRWELSGLNLLNRRSSQADQAVALHLTTVRNPAFQLWVELVKLARGCVEQALFYMCLLLSCLLL